MTKAKIIIVEDESITAYDLQVRLEGMGYEVPAIASTGDEAISITALHQPDLILMDIRIRGEKDGIQVAQEIRARFNIPVIYLTAFADDATIHRARVTEPFGYLLKPFQEQELYSSVEMALYKHKAESKLRENEQRLKIYAERLEVLHEIEQSILGVDSPSDISHSVLSSIGKLVSCHSAMVLTINDELQTAYILASLTHPHDDLDVRELSIENASFFNELLPGQIKTLTVSELLTVLPDLENVIRKDGEARYSTIPLRNQDQLIGILILGTQTKPTYEQTQLAIMRELASSLALAIHHSSLHQELAKHAIELEQRNQDLDAYAHTVAHDLKSPIAVILGFAEILTDDKQTFTQDNVRKYLELIARTGHKMHGIVNELLLLAEVRKQDVQLYPLDMGRIVDKAQSRLSFEISKGNADVKTPITWPLALGYSPWIEEVWINYINNALKYGGNPPKIWLGADEKLDSELETLHYRFWVRDNGDGIPPAEQKVLFTPFTRMDQVRAQGHGLGLSIVYRIVTKMGGYVGVESSGIAGQGCLFFFTLPAAHVDEPTGVSYDNA